MGSGKEGKLGNSETVGPHQYVLVICSMWYYSWKGVAGTKDESFILGLPIWIDSAITEVGRHHSSAWGPVILWFIYADHQFSSRNVVWVPLGCANNDVFILFALRRALTISACLWGAPCVRRPSAKRWASGEREPRKRILTVKCVVGGLTAA